MSTTLDQFREACRREDWELAAQLELRLHPTSQFKRGQLTPLAARRFILSGNAYITICNMRLQTRQTFRIRFHKRSERFYVDALSGPDNNADYDSIGIINAHVLRVRKPDDHRAQAFVRFYNTLGLPTGTPLCFPPDWVVYHEGRCGRCARRLTVPSSIELGIGPECADKMENDGTWAAPGRLEAPEPKAPTVPSNRKFMEGLFE